MVEHKDVNTEIEDWNKLISSAKQLLLATSLLFLGAFGVTYIPTWNEELLSPSRFFKALYYTFIFSGGAHLTSQYTSKPINAFTNALSPYLDNIYLDPDVEKYKNLLARYSNLRPCLDDNNSQVLDYYFLMYRTWLYDVSNPEWRRFVIKNVSMYIEYNFKVLEQPSSKKQIQLSKNDIDLTAIQLLNLLETYPQQREAILEFVKCMGFYQLRDEEYKNLRAICLEGPPGVGKTTLIQKVCDIYGINLVTLKGKATIGEYSYGRQFYEDFIPAKASPIVQTLYNSQNLGFSGYTVMFFDEIDKLPHNPEAAASSNMPTLQEVAQFLLELTDNNQTTIKDPYTGLNYPKNRIIVIMAVNENILSLIPGLASRTDVILFEKIDQKNKLEIALNKLKTFCNENDLECTAELQNVVSIMVDNNEEDGVRELIEDIRALVYSLSQNSFYEGTLLQKPQNEILSHYEHLKRIKSIPNESNELENEESLISKPSFTP